MFSVVSITVYVLFLAFMLIGARIPEKGKFNEDFLSLESTKSLLGIAAVGVILHHISQKDPFQQTGNLIVFPLIGFLFVGIFFLCSGYGLLKSLDTKPGYLNGFFKRRILPVMIAFYVMNVIYAVWHLVSGIAVPSCASEWICKFIGISLMNTQSWYAIVIVIYYASFSFAYRKFSDRNKALLFIFFITAVQIAIFMIFRHYAWWTGVTPKDFETCQWWKRPCQLPYSGEWWINSLIMFPLGIMLYQYEKPVVEWFKKHYWLKITILFFIMLITTTLGIFAMWNWGYWREFGGDNSVLPKFITFIFQTVQIVFFCAFIIFIRMKIYSVNALTKFFSTITLEFYLMQELPLLTYEKLFYVESLKSLPCNLYLLVYFAVVFLTVLVLALCFKKINSFVYGFFKGKN